MPKPEIAGDYKPDGSTPLANSARTTPVVLGPLLFVLCLAIIGFVLQSASSRVTWELLLRDPAATFRGSPFSGLLSHVGVITMMSIGCICLFTATLVTHHKSVLICASLFAFAFGLDDLVMAHETVLPEALGVPEVAVFSAYGVTVLVLIAMQRKFYGRPETVLLALSPIFFGLSAILDQVPLASMSVDLEMVLEDFAKLMGIACWGGYWIATCRGLIANGGAAT